jgi:hypothetical protein
LKPAFDQMYPGIVCFRRDPPLPKKNFGMCNQASGKPSELSCTIRYLHEPRIKIPKRVGNWRTQVTVDVDQLERLVVRHLRGGFRKIAFDVANVLLPREDTYGLQRGVLELHLAHGVHAPRSPTTPAWPGTGRNRRWTNSSPTSRRR